MKAPATVSPARVLETDETDSTYSVGNGEFLLTAFGAKLADARPMLVSCSGDPTKVASNAWIERPWHAEREAPFSLPAGANNYFSLAVSTPDKTGMYRRQKTRSAALHTVMLDDVGTKLNRERLTLPPSWLLKTSAGNHQDGYLLRQPLADCDAADRLMEVIVAAGLCDPGANGPRARLGRLPAAVNGKHTPPFPCRMIEKRPELRCSINAVVAGLQLEMTPAGRAQRPKTRAVQDRPRDSDPVWLPRPEEDAVLAAIRDGGRYEVPLGDGRHDVTCPWVQEYTGAADGGTAYFEPDESWPIGGFKCLHGHCAQRQVRDLPDRETLGRRLRAWQSVFGKTAAMVRDAVKHAAFNDEHVDLRVLLHDIADERGELNRRELGWWIKRHAGRIVDGLRFVRASGKRSAQAWQVESVSPVSSLPTPPTTERASRGT